MVLLVSPKIYTHHVAVFQMFDKASHAVRKTFLVDPSGAGTLAFREDHDGFSAFQQVHAFFQRLFHFFPGATAINRNTFGEIAQNRQQDIVFVIGPFRQIPRHFFIMDDVLRQAEHGVT